jgi:hypothetical protein
MKLTTNILHTSLRSQSPSISQRCTLLRVPSKLVVKEI